MIIFYYEVKKGGEEKRGAIGAIDRQMATKKLQQMFLGYRIIEIYAVKYNNF